MFYQIIFIFYLNRIMSLHCNKNHKQECIPVGYIPPTAVAVGRGAPPGTPQGADPPDQAPPPPGADPPGPGTPRPGTPCCKVCWDSTHPPLWTEWQTGVKILACPKLRFRAVINCFSYHIMNPCFFSECSLRLNTVVLLVGFNHLVLISI